ncbi:MAG: SH3 domain-containing protein [Leptolyngbyaceae cyanobacterium SM2_3_12]|nr:SH3 domain-containing protein [Leptolyngbyaceae cyanobacterium SM2_3_12]
MKGFFVGLTKLIFGLTIALMLLSMAGIATARYFMARLSVLPAKPLFDNEQPAAPVPEATDPAAIPPVAAPPAAAPPVAAVSTSPSDPAIPTPDPAATPELAPGTYEAVVVQPIGLVLRAGPSTDQAQVGGVDYNDEVIILEAPADQSWVRVRVQSSGQEGWIKAGNTRPVE